MLFKKVIYSHMALFDTYYTPVYIVHRACNIAALVQSHTISKRHIQLASETFLHFLHFLHFLPSLLSKTPFLIILNKREFPFPFLLTLLPSHYGIYYH